MEAVGTILVPDASFGGTPVLSFFDLGQLSDRWPVLPQFQYFFPLFHSSVLVGFLVAQILSPLLQLIQHPLLVFGSRTKCLIVQGTTDCWSSHQFIFQLLLQLTVKKRVSHLMEQGIVSMSPSIHHTKSPTLSVPSGDAC